MNRQIIEEASEWFVEIGEGDTDIATRQRFHDWLARSPEHIQAYLKILPVWEEGAKLDTHGNDREALIAWARTETNVVPFTASMEVSSGSDAGTGRKSWRRAYRYAFAATVALAVAGALSVLTASRSIYSTDIGEQKIIALEDGSKVELNSRSRLKVRFDDRGRSIELIEGQAMFQVAKDPARPFVVHSGGTLVRAVGTQFDVYRKPAATVVTVLEGRVQVRGRELSLLSAGEQVIVTSSGKPVSRRANVATATAWTQQQLVFFRTPLPEVAEEFNRYNKRQLVVKDEALKTFHVSGTFSSTDPSLLIRFLRDQAGLNIEETDRVVFVDAR